MKNFARTLWRVVLIGWRVSPVLYVIQAVITVVQGLLPLLQAYLVAQLLGAIAHLVLHPGEPVEPVIWLMVALGGIQFIISQTSFLSFYLDDKFNLAFDLQVQSSLFNKVHELDQTYYEDQEFNNRLNKVTQNVYSLRSMNRNLLMTGNSLVQLVSTAVAIISFEPMIALVVTLAMIPVLLIEVRTSLKRWHNWDEKGNDWRLAWYLRHMLSDVIRLREIKLYGLKDYLVKRWEGHMLASRQSELAIERRAQRWRAVASAVEITVNTGSQIWLLLRVLQRGTGLDSFVFYRQMIDNYANASSSLVRNLHTMQDNSLYVNDYFDLLALEPRLKTIDKPAKLAEDSPAPKIEFENVSFTYPGSKAPVLKHISLVLEPGEDLAIVGANGAGKTTLVKLLLRLYDPTSGRILVDGRDLRELDLAGWYRQIGALFQDFNKYTSLSVFDNIAVGRPERPGRAAGVPAAARAAGADHFIDKYPDGYDQLLDRSYKDGVEPSGGQWQRIALARAFFRDARILILDEPTSAIDAKGEYEIFKKIGATQKDKTTIIISHRFSTVRNAHKIIVLERGTITERGSHEELVKLGGKYRELFELQAEGYR